MLGEPRKRSCARAYLCARVTDGDSIYRDTDRQWGIEQKRQPLDALRMTVDVGFGAGGVAGGRREFRCGFVFDFGCGLGPDQRWARGQVLCCFPTMPPRRK